MMDIRKLAAVATTVAATVPAFSGTALASAGNQRVDGVRAAIHHGVLQVRGGDADNRIAILLKAGDAGVIQVDVGDNNSPDISFDRADVAEIDLRGGDGGDALRIDDSNGSFTNTIPTTISGGDEADRLTGGLGNETFRGGDGNDNVVGGKGADTAYLGDGDDEFRWDNGDGSDVIEGQDGRDKMVFNGAQGPETATLTANGHRLTFFRVQGNVTMDTRGVETVDDNTLGGADNVTVNDLSGTDVTQVNIDLAGALGGNAGDRTIDNVVVNGTEGDDNIAVTGSGSQVDVTGLASAVSVKHPDADDKLSVNTLGGNDSVFTSGVAGLVQLLVDGAAA
jgi:Ca2+-binding RTX toxin-like protein